MFLKNGESPEYSHQSYFLSPEDLGYAKNPIQKVTTRSHVSNTNNLQKFHPPHTRHRCCSRFDIYSLKWRRPPGPYIEHRKALINPLLKFPMDIPPPASTCVMLLKLKYFYQQHKELCDKAGFGCMATFAVAFRLNKGDSPAEWCKKNAKNLNKDDESLQDEKI